MRAPSCRTTRVTLSVGYGLGGWSRLRSPLVARDRTRDRAVAEAFGARVRELRLERGMTQEGLAEAAELHATFVSNLERGYRVPSLPTVLRVAAGLGVDAGSLVDGLNED